MNIDPTAHRQLFLDDHAIEYTDGVERVLHQPDKQGPVLRADLDRGQYAVQSRNAPQWNAEKGIWEWFYWAYYEDGANPIGETRVNSYATSTDLLHWEGPSKSASAH